MATVGPAEAKWLLQFTSSVYKSDEGEGRPWGDGTAMAERAATGANPWDAGCQVKPMIGGDQALSALRDTFEAAITAANEMEADGVPAAERGHVYIADWGFNALRDLSSTQPWGGKPWNPKETVKKDQTALGFVLRMMAAGINVRLLLWMPNVVEIEAAVKSIAVEHWNVAAAIQEFSDSLGGSEPRGVVALDLRTATPPSASLHQKMVAVRVGPVNLAFCGGVDFAFTRRDFGLPANRVGGIGDWQSGSKIPNPEEGWPKQSPPPGNGYPSFPYFKVGAFPEGLPANVYGGEYLHWHDHYLQLGGPIVATLEQQFAERWIIDSDGMVEVFEAKEWKDPSEVPWSEITDRVKLTSAACIGETGTGRKFVKPLPKVVAVAPKTGGTTVQMWRTIPLRYLGGTEPPFQRGEFTVLAGVANAVSKATQLITICDQYFWSEPLARQLAAQMKANAGLRLLIVLPPYGAESSYEELGLRRAALKALYDGLENEAGRERVLVYGMWLPGPKSVAEGRGVYVHAKSQTYDDQLFVCGSANMNRRSLECDDELDCAVLGQRAVTTHIGELFQHLTGAPWSDFKPEWLKRYWEAIKAKSGKTLITDPFFSDDPGDPETPNGVPMTFATDPDRELFDPTSIGTKLDSSTCEEECEGDPKAPGRLDEVTFLLERCHNGAEWPFRQASVTGEEP